MKKTKYTGLLESTPDPRDYHIQIVGTASTAGSANKLSVARQIKLTGDVEGAAYFDGSDNISISVKSLRTAALKNAYAPDAKNMDISLYAQYNNVLYYRVGSNSRVKLQNG